MTDPRDRELEILLDEIDPARLDDEALDDLEEFLPGDSWDDEDEPGSLWDSYEE